MEGCQFCCKYSPCSSLTRSFLNFPIVSPISLFDNLVSLTTKLFPIVIIEALGRRFSTILQVILKVSTLLFANSLSDLLYVVLSRFGSNSNGFKVIGDRGKLNFSHKAILDDRLARGNNVRNISGVTGCFAHM